MSSKTVGTFVCFVHCCVPVPGQGRAHSRCSSTAWMNATKGAPPSEALRWLPLVTRFCHSCLAFLLESPPCPVLSPGPGTATGGWYPRRKPLAGKEPGSPGGCGEVAGLRDPQPLADQASPLPCRPTSACGSRFWATATTACRAYPCPCPTTPGTV